MNRFMGSAAELLERAGAVAKPVGTSGKWMTHVRAVADDVVGAGKRAINPLGYSAIGSAVAGGVAGGAYSAYSGDNRTGRDVLLGAAGAYGGLMGYRGMRNAVSSYRGGAMSAMKSEIGGAITRNAALSRTMRGTVPAGRGMVATSSMSAMSAAAPIADGASMYRGGF